MSTTVKAGVTLVMLLLLIGVCGLLEAGIISFGTFAGAAPPIAGVMMALTEQMEESEE